MEQSLCYFTTLFNILFGATLRTSHRPSLLFGYFPLLVINLYIYSIINGELQLPLFTSFTAATIEEYNTFFLYMEHCITQRESFLASILLWK
jgi:hypothetical protein